MQELIIVTPVYNDWQSLQLLADEIAGLARMHDLKIHMIAVDDGSALPSDLQAGKWTRRLDLQIVRLTRNLGHQRAVAVGLAYANEMNDHLPVIVMDCDGEDQPADIPRLLDAHQQDAEKIIFARRDRRSENLLFRACYFFFKLLFPVLTGRRISFGNYSLLPPESLKRIVHLQEIWNHFPAGVMHSSLQWTTIPTSRGRRYAGRCPA